MHLGAALLAEDLDAVARELGLPPLEARQDAWQRARAKVARDIEAARGSDARLSPTFFINGRRYEGPWDEASLAEAMLGSVARRVQAAALDFARWAPSTGVLLLLAAVLAILLANSPLGPVFEELWQTELALLAGAAGFSLPLRGWVNDGLLTLFFLVIGLEIKRELSVGRLASWRSAALPLGAAFGGMAAAALLYLAIAPAGQAAGWAIPTTTDTAFAVALIAVLGKRVPVELRIFLTAAVIVDDLAAIAIVALFYSTGLQAEFVLAAAATTAALAFLNRSGVYAPFPYVALGIVLWVCLERSGLHATLAGVIVAVLTPTRPPADLRALLAQAEAIFQYETRTRGEELLRHGPSERALRALDGIHDRIESPAAKLLRSLAPWSSYLVLPIFALANAGLAWSPGILEGNGALILAIVAGLMIGKPAGIFLAAAIAVRAGIAIKSAAYSWTQLLGAGALAGTGFTMSLYLAAKAFPDPATFGAAKLAIFLASLASGALGTFLLWRSCPSCTTCNSRRSS
jgi:Na+:H+ antiporter, NhaA family